MEQKKNTRYDMQAIIMKALAHPTRILIVHELEKGELCVGEITALVTVDTSTISKHLSILKNAGIVVDNKRGLSVYYTLKMPCVLKFFICIDDVLKKNANDQITLFA